MHSEIWTIHAADSAADAVPFELIFFVMVDGWYLIAGSLVRSFNPAG